MPLCHAYEQSGGRGRRMLKDVMRRDEMRRDEDEDTYDQDSADQVIQSRDRVMPYPEH